MLLHSQAGVFQCFSLIAALLGSVLGALYGYKIIEQSLRHQDLKDRRNNGPANAILGMILILGIVECVIGCLATASVNRMMICCFSSPPPQVRLIYNSPFRISVAAEMPH